MSKINGDQLVKIKNIVLTIGITFVLSFFLEGINDPNVFIFSNWRKNNVVNILHLWATFLTTYYLCYFIIEVGIKKPVIDDSKKLIRLLLLTQLIALLWVISTDVLFYILYYKIVSLNETTFYEFDVPLTIVILTIGGVYFYQKNYFTLINIKKSDSTDQLKFEKSLEVFKGSKSIFINHSDIAMIHLSDKIVWLTTIDNETFQTSFSLAALTNMLPSSTFFRLNRQGIISKKIIKGYNRIEYQKLEVLIDDDFCSALNLVVSKYNAPNFKKWLTNST